MSQYSWIFVNKNYLFIAILATVLAIPVGMVTADIVFDNPENVDVETDGVNSFDALEGAQGVETFMNGTDNFALVASFDDDAVTLVDLSNPKDIIAKDILDGSPEGTTAAGTTSEGRLVLDGASSLALVSNSTSAVGGHFAVVTSYLGDGIQVIHSDDERSDSAHAIYPTLNMTKLWGGGTGPLLKGLDGAMDVAIFTNQTAGDSRTFAVVTGHVGDSIQLIEISDPEVGGMLYYNSSGNFMNATALGGAGTHAAADYKTQWGPALSGKLPLDGAFGVDVFYSTEDGNMPYAIVTGQVSDAFQIFSLNDTDRGPVPVANRTSSSTGFGLLDSPTGVATWNTTNNDSDRWAIITSNYTDSVTVVSLADPSNTSVTDTLVQNSQLSLDGALRVEVSKIGDRHYAFVASNGTATSTGSNAHIEAGGLQVIDLYDPSNIQPVTAITDGEGLFTSLAAAHDVGVFTLDGHTYAAVVSYDDDGLHIIKITADKTSSNNRICGVSYDCSAPSMASNGGGVTINGNSLATEDRYNDGDTTSAKVGQMVTIKTNIYDSFGGDEIYKSNLYFDFTGPSPDWNDASSAIKYDLIRDELEIVGDGFEGSASASISGDIATVTFKIMFTEPMDASHIAIQNIDNSRNYQLKYFRDAVEVTGTPTQTSAEATLEDEVVQTATATVPDWVKNTAGWWADGAISEGEFVNAIEHLVKTGTIIII